MNEKRRNFLTTAIAAAVSLVVGKLGFARPEEPEFGYVIETLRCDGKLDVIVGEGRTYQMKLGRKYGAITVKGGRLVGCSPHVVDIEVINIYPNLQSVVVGKS